MERRPRIIATVINDVVYDQRMIRACTTLSEDYDVALWGRKLHAAQTSKHPYQERRFRFLVSSGPLFYLVYNTRVFLALLFAKFDILHAVDLDTLPAAFFASKLKGKKLVYDSHEYFTEVPELINRPRKRAIWLRLEKFFLPKVVNCITVGRKIAEAYEKKYGNAFSVVKNAPLYDQTKEVLAKPGSYLVYPGALNKGRGLEAAICAMHKIDTLTLKIAGKGDLEEELKALVKNEGLQDKVSFLGMLNKEELHQLNIGAFAGVNVSENIGLSYFYSLNNKFFDFIHAGLPAITNEFPEYVNLNKEFKTCVFASAVSNDIADAVNLLLDDKSLYERLRKNCLLARQKLSWQYEAVKLKEVYANLK